MAEDPQKQKPEDKDIVDTVIDTVAGWFKMPTSMGSGTMNCQSLINMEIASEKMTDKQLAKLAECKLQSNPGAEELSEPTDNSQEESAE